MPTLAAHQQISIDVARIDEVPDWHEPARGEPFVDGGGDAHVGLHGQACLDVCNKVCSSQITRLGYMDLVARPFQLTLGAVVHPRGVGRLNAFVNQGLLGSITPAWRAARIAFEMRVPDLT